MPEKEGMDTVEGAQLVVAVEENMVIVGQHVCSEWAEQKFGSNGIYHRCLICGKIVSGSGEGRN